MRLYRFNEVTGELLGFIVHDRDDYGGRTDLTLVDPPPREPYKKAVWDGFTWNMAPDYRGVIFHDANGLQMPYLELWQVPDPTWKKVSG